MKKWIDLIPLEKETIYLENKSLNLNEILNEKIIKYYISDMYYYNIL